MTTHNDDEYRARLIEKVRRIEAQQQAAEMTDAELDAAICVGLGLPQGTVLTEEQLDLLIDLSEGPPVVGL